MERLEYVAMVLRSWGVVGQLREALAAAPKRPRVGKAVSLFLDVPPEKFEELMAS